MQFMFDLSNVGAPMRGWLCVQLGTWHPYKQANCVLWSHWGPTIFGPLFNELIPNANFNKKAKLSTVVKFLNMVRLSYPSWKSELQSALRDAEAKNVDTVAISHMRDLTKLMEFFIPVVSVLLSVFVNDCININQVPPPRHSFESTILFININKMCA